MLLVDYVKKTRRTQGVRKNIFFTDFEQKWEKKFF